MQTNRCFFAYLTLSTEVASRTTACRSVLLVVQSVPYHLGPARAAAAAAAVRSDLPAAATAVFFFVVGAAARSDRIYGY